ncbi:MAG: T9SS type A sorting domain-containing protein [Flavobacteriales bacterium]|nr:T9SS type A sorting domain-containing protein [Flavobacteriales bacterium]
MKKICSSLFLLILLFNSSNAQDGPDWVVRFDSAYVGGYSVGLRETFTMHNLKLDASNNLYVGFGSKPLADSDFMLRSLTPEGSARWDAGYAGSAGLEDLLTCLDVSPEGNCYVSGYATESGSGQITTTIGYDATGNQLWIDQLTDTPYLESRANALILDKNENVYVAVTAFVTASNYDMVLIKYNKNGQRQWVKRFDRNAGPDRAVSIALSHDQNFIYLCGTTNNTGSGDDLSVIGYATVSGNQIWAHHYDFLPGTANPEDAVAVACDTMGYVYATGNSYSGANNDIVLIKLRGADGTKSWDSRFDDTLKGNDGVFDLIVSDFGNIYLGGHSIDGLGGTSFLVLKYNAVGNLVWRSAYAGSNLKIDRVSNLALGGPNMDLYVAGSANTGVNQSYEFVALRYDPSTGDTLWVGRGDNTTWSGSGITTGLAVTNEGYVYVTGRTNSASIARFNPDRLSVSSLSGSDRVHVYPNPSSGQLYIRSEGMELIEIELSDLSGRLLEKRNEIRTDQLELRTDLNGVYILKIRTAKGVFVHRIALY